MPKTYNIDLVRYEYIVYTHLLETSNISEILLTMDVFDDMGSVSDLIKWTPVKNMNIDIIDSVEDTVNDGDVSSGKTKNRICGLFDAEPLDWKYARILVDNKAGTKHNFAIARMPRSPIIPVIFEVTE